MADEEKRAIEEEKLNFYYERLTITTSKKLRIMNVSHT